MYRLGATPKVGTTGTLTPRLGLLVASPPPPLQGSRLCVSSRRRGKRRPPTCLGRPTPAGHSSTRQVQSLSHTSGRSSSAEVLYLRRV